ncbi:multiple epidermal growth factor-like domains protein 10 [Saccostrea cucullata]|uniref:multiple epidermal growth factor-like domains protein 10 n=1 Tax=Saccostrea cuccullata TaxID=36930 RepID=UPI002ED5C712
MSASSCILVFLVVRRVLTYQQLVVPGETTASSSTVYQNFYPSRTVDGDFSQAIGSCSHTGTDPAIREAWLRVDLGSVYSLKFVKLWYRNDRGSVSLSTIRLRGYTIKLSNSTQLSDAETCYSDTGNDALPTILTNDCEGTSRFVWFHTTSVPDSRDTVPMLEICEVQIFGCQTGLYGENCSLTCDHCMNPSSCDIDSGECDTFGCAHTGLLPTSCRECIPGYFGGNCSSFCHANCYNVSCDQSTGQCNNGCKPGFDGLYCNQTCRGGKYGAGCQEDCGKCHDASPCHHLTGYCNLGCEKGYRGSLCKQTCDPGKFGVNCTSICSAHCQPVSSCAFKDGSCTCEEGWRGNKCDTPACEDGWFGYDCANQCSRYCYNNTICDKETGNCPSGCIVGYVPPACLQNAYSINGNDGSSLHVMSLGAGIAMGIGICFLIFVFVFILKGLIRKQRTNETQKPDYDNEDSKNSKFPTGIPKEEKCDRNYPQYQNNSYVDLMDDPDGIVYEVISQ